jgi:hypothetical protein
MSMIIDGTNGITFNNSTTQASAGQVLQVVSSTYATQTSIAVSTYTNSGLTASITPKFSTSKIYIIVSFMAYVPSAKNLLTTITRGSTNLGSSTYGMGTVYGSSSGVQSACAISYLDSPATTSSTAYNLAIGAELGTAYICFNNEKASITLLEVAG